MKENITFLQAYSAMYSFLERYYEINNKQELGMLLSDMSLLEDGSTADPAIWDDWLVAVKTALSGEVDNALKLKKL